jgi:hypothetical protein
VRGEIYTIDGLAEEPGGLLLKEVKTGNEPVAGYWARRFRPLVENASDSEVEAAIYRRTRQRKTQRIPHHGPVS